MVLKRKNSSGTWDVVSTNTAVVDNLSTADSTKALSAKMGKALQESKLNLSGGTMTGAINFANQAHITTGVNNSRAGMYGATNYSNGAYIELYGKDNSSLGTAGAFKLGTNSYAGSSTLIGYPNGTLQWNGKDIAMKTDVGMQLKSVSLAPPIGESKSYKICDALLRTGTWESRQALIIVYSNYYLFTPSIVSWQIYSGDSREPHQSLSLVAGPRLHGSTDVMGKFVSQYTTTSSDYSYGLWFITNGGYKGFNAWVLDNTGGIWGNTRLDAPTAQTVSVEI